MPNRSDEIDWHKTMRGERWRIRLASFDRTIDRNFIDRAAMTYGGTARRNTILDPTI